MSDWQRLLETAKEVQDGFPEGMAFIGGIATYAHVTACPPIKQYSNSTHDADIVMSQHDFTDLIDIESVVSNRRLGKHQFTKNGFEFDVYSQQASRLGVSSDEIIARSVMKMGLRVANIANLLQLKLAAYDDRKGSSKGQKDEDDILRLLICALYDKQKISIGDDDLILLKQIVSGQAAMRMAKGNSKTASTLKGLAKKTVETLT